MRRRIFFILGGGVWALGLWAAPVHAEPSVPSAGYEERVVEWGLAQEGLLRAPAPEGKRVEAVVVVRQNIVAPSDPYPNVLNALHVRTREHVVRREVLLEVGAPYRTELAEETERNLLGLGIFSLARVVAARGSAEDSVVLVVVTKDIWSIRFSTDYNLVGSLLQYLRIQPSEANFLGRGKRLGLDFQLNLSAFSVGQSYVDRRLWGSSLALSESASVVFNRDSGRAEGSMGALTLSRPLRTLDSEWAGSASGGLSVQPVRYFRGAAPEVVVAPDGAVLPFAYHQEVVTGALSLTRSLGRAFKHNLTASVGAYQRVYQPPEGLLLTPENLAFFEAAVLPRSETAQYLSGRAHGYTPVYRVFRNLASFALSERVQVGPSWVAELRWAPGLWDTARYAEGLGSVRYSWALGDSLTRVTATAAARYWTDAALAQGGPRWVDRHFGVELFEATPELWVGRVVCRALFELKRFEQDPIPFRLGGGNGLRGVPPEVFLGSRRALLNVEYRTRPIELRTLHVGGAVFYDAGGAFDATPVFAHTVGLGLRLLFPQFDVEPLRIDFGYALRGPQAVGLNGINSAFGQVTEYNRTFVADPHN